MKNAKFIKAIINIVIICFCFSYACFAQAQEKKGSLISVGDANLTYASYIFILPYGWIPLMDNMQLTEERGFFRGKHADSQVWMQITPLRKEGGDTLESVANNAIQQDTKTAGCPPDSGQENSSFIPQINYPYKAYSLNNCPQGTYGLLVLVELPEHLISFNLYGEGENENFLSSYTGDFNKAIGSFRWLLGLSDAEIAEKFKELQ